MAGKGTEACTRCLRACHVPQNHVQASLYMDEAMLLEMHV